MFKALYTSATGMKGQQLYVDTIANNLANVNTTGFKRSQIAFQDLLYEAIVTPGTESAQGFEIPTGLQIGSGVKFASSTKVFTPGTLINTGNQLDVAIQGKGFFQVTMPDGTATYTRDGTLRLNSQGQIVTSQGNLLSPALTVPADTTDISIGADGTVDVIQGGSSTPTNIGQITLATFANPGGLIALGGNLFKESASSGAATTGVPGQGGLGELTQGFLEGSNVDVVTELVSLILAQRAYEINSRAIRSSDDMMAIVNNLQR
jgi:flagellar basal-body rod protein FlgG